MLSRCLFAENPFFREEFSSQGVLRPTWVSGAKSISQGLPFRPVEALPSSPSLFNFRHRVDTPPPPPTAPKIFNLGPSLRRLSEFNAGLYLA
ncbi:hypothetical protein CDAR_98011 [Caerostris darwini]|uniref:Uncharacterized protein n=1 Tax=Caerostris darwini TaxID=1538125 RepID=A0AAV4SL05_9ARAC|nr:hypothetical protein CDAR_98011 [Caerostris darwini]